MEIKMPWGDTMPVSAYNPLEHAYQHVIGEIYRTYGVRALFKGKTLRKFGRTNNADNGVKTTIATFGSVGTPNVVETRSTSNDIDRLSSSNVSDTGVLTIEGHTIDGLGNLTFIVQDVTLTGQTPAVIPTPMARLTRMYVKDGTFASPSVDLVGDIYGFASSGVTVTNGVPQTNTAVKARIIAGKNQTEKSATSLSQFDFWLMTEVSVTATRGNGSSVNSESDVEVARIGGVFRPVGLELSLRTSVNVDSDHDFVNGIIIPPNSDVRQVIISDTDNTSGTGFMSGLLLTTKWTYDPKTQEVTFH